MTAVEMPQEILDLIIGCLPLSKPSGHRDVESCGALLTLSLVNRACCYSARLTRFKHLELHWKSNHADQKWSSDNRRADQLISLLSHPLNTILMSVKKLTVVSKEEDVPSSSHPSILSVLPSFAGRITALAVVCPNYAVATALRDANILSSIEVLVLGGVGDEPRSLITGLIAGCRRLVHLSLRFDLPDSEEVFQHSNEDLVFPPSPANIRKISLHGEGRHMKDWFDWLTAASCTRADFLRVHDLWGVGDSNCGLPLYLASLGSHLRHFTSTFAFLITGNALIYPIAPKLIPSLQRDTAGCFSTTHALGV